VISEAHMLNQLDIIEFQFLFIISFVFGDAVLYLYSRIMSSHNAFAYSITGVALLVQSLNIFRFIMRV
jgi:hypothetical protein